MSNNCKHPTCMDSPSCRRENKAAKPRAFIKRTPIKKVFNQKVKSDELEKFFDDAAKELAAHPYCDNCGAWISPEDYRNATAHIFPKNKFKSVKAHPMNRLFLGVRCGCHDKSHRLDTFSKMKIWYIAVANFKIFEPLITEKHKYLNSFKQIIEDGKIKAL